MSLDTRADCTRDAGFANIMSGGSNVSAPAHGCCLIRARMNVNISSCPIRFLKNKPKRSCTLLDKTRPS